MCLCKFRCEMSDWDAEAYSIVDDGNVGMVSVLNAISKTEQGFHKTELFIALAYEWYFVLMAKLCHRIL